MGTVIATCVALGVDPVLVTPAERKLIAAASADLMDVEQTKNAIREGKDPLGEAFCAVRSVEDRRPSGQTFTPASIVSAMLKWASNHPAPARIVDPGTGSGRYITAALQIFPEATGIAADLDPVATLMTRANAHVLELDNRIDVRLADYRGLNLPEIKGHTLFLGNPPYIRHHDINAHWKEWLGLTAASMSLKASKLAGLHAYFFLATASYARPGDLGTFITSSEWLDVNYGKLIRDLLVGPLSVESLHIVDPTTLPFEDAQVTGTISCFVVGSTKPEVRIQRVSALDDLGSLDGGFKVSRQRLAEASRWSVITRVTPKIPEGFIELGEIAKVHRGTVTGANKVWVVRPDAVDLPDEVLYPTITRARELFAAGDRLCSTADLKRVVDLPADLDIFDCSDRRRVNRFLKRAKAQGVEQGYVARNRRAWWSVGLAQPAPILATYMARRPPAFVRNAAQARHINIAHGLYPRQLVDPQDLDLLAEYLRTNVTLGSGRTYAGGLTKFEPREMERLVVPTLAMLREGAQHGSGSTPALDG